MFNRCYVLIILSLISGVLGIINIDNSNKIETKCKLVHLEVKIKKMESDTLDRLITYMDGKIVALNRKIQERLEIKITQEINALKKTVEENLENKIKQEINASNKKEEDNLLNTNQTLNALNKKVDHISEEKIAPTSNAPGTMKELLEKNQTSAQLPCKEESLRAAYRDSSHFSMDNETFNHVTVKRDSAGLLTYFEMHVAIQADGDVDILLCDMKDLLMSDIQYNLWIGWRSNQYTQLQYKWTKVKKIPTPKILSPTEFRTFYIKVDNGTLQFGKEGDSSPLVSHYDARFRSLKYFWFFYHGFKKAEIRYDCPVPGLGRS